MHNVEQLAVVHSQMADIPTKEVFMYKHDISAIKSTGREQDEHSTHPTGSVHRPGTRTRE